MMLEPILEPIVFGFKANQNAGWLAMPGDHDLLGGCQTQIVREIILDRRESYFTALPARARRARLRLLPW
jgi:hypothetical protein